MHAALYSAAYLGNVQLDGRVQLGNIRGASVPHAGIGARGTAARGTQHSFQKHRRPSDCWAKSGVEVQSRLAGGLFGQSASLPACYREQAAKHRPRVTPSAAPDPPSSLFSHSLTQHDASWHTSHIPTLCHSLLDHLDLKASGGPAIRHELNRCLELELGCRPGISPEGVRLEDPICQGGAGDRGSGGV